MAKKKSKKKISKPKVPDEITVPLEEGCHLEHGFLVLVLPAETEDPPLSGSRKSFNIASTEGQMKTDLEVNGEQVRVTATAFYKNRDYTPDK